MTEIEMMKPLQHKGTNRICTKRLVLRQFTNEDYKDMFVWASNPEVVKYLSYEPHQSLETSYKTNERWVKAYISMETYIFGLHT